MAPKRTQVRVNIYRLRVELTQAPYDEGEGTWRVVEIRGNQTLHQLHRAIFKAFGRWEHHLYSFYLSANRRDHTQEYASPDFFEAEEWEPDAPRDAGSAKLDSLGLAAGARFWYVFDYGDDWEHRVTVLSISDETPMGRYPRIIERRGASPRQYPVPGPEEWEEEDVPRGPAKIIHLSDFRE